MKTASLLNKFTVTCWRTVGLRKSLGVLGMLLIAATARPASCSNIVTATHLANSFTNLAAASGGSEFDSASLTLFIDPAATQWIAWNDAPEIVKTDPGHPGQLFLGPGGIGVDDFIRLTVTNLTTNSSLTLDTDQNNGVAVSFGPQNVIFGTAADAPDVMRDPGGFPGPKQFLDEAGGHNAVFTTPGMYSFQLSFRNQFATSAAHPEMWLLVSTVPEPTTAATAGVLLAVFVGVARWRKQRGAC